MGFGIVPMISRGQATLEGCTQCLVLLLTIQLLLFRCSETAVVMAIYNMSELFMPTYRLKVILFCYPSLKPKQPKVVRRPQYPPYHTCMKPVQISFRMLEIKVLLGRVRRANIHLWQSILYIEFANLVQCFEDDCSNISLA